MNKVFLNWLHNAQLKPGLVNSYYYALFTDRLPYVLRKMDSSQEIQDESIPTYFEKYRNIDIAFEMEKENGIESLLLRQLLIDLLKLAWPEKRIGLDIMEVVRAFVLTLYTGKTEKILPASKNFHQLPSGVKMWILCALIQVNSDESIESIHPEPIGRDSAGNLYFCVTDKLLYVQYGTILQEMTRPEEDIKMKPLERSLYSMPPWKLLADSEASWRRTAMLIESFEEEEIAGKIEETLLRIFKKAEQKQVNEKQKERNTETDSFERGIQSRRSRTQLKRPPSIRDEEESRRPSKSPKRPSENAEHRSLRSPQFEQQSGAGYKAKTVRCMYYPDCKRSDEDCFFVHPRQTCINFGTPSCPGMYCRFVHPDCPKDGACTDNSCPYEHTKTMPSLRRVFYAKMKEGSQGSQASRLETASSRSTVSSGYGSEGKPRVDFDVMAKNFNHLSVREREPSPPRRTNEPVYNERPFSNKELRCHYFPRCSKPAEKCSYAHPREFCASFPNCKRGRDCPFLHGACTIDGRCNNEFCQFEHYQQIPPRASIAYQRHLASKRDQH